MLCLRRNNGQSIMMFEAGTKITFVDGREITLDKPIEITQRSERHGRYYETWIKVDAPREIHVLRREILERKAS
jgi:sRNA-binding carbon storage regulator CsrA